MNYILSGQLVDIIGRTTYPAQLTIKDGHISSIDRIDQAPNRYILPGFIDAHVHIESSMLIPTSFARIAVCHGTVGTISDPHEIANVNGLDGVEYMIRNAALTPLKIYFGAPSCVPATRFETAGAEISANDIDYLFSKHKLHYLSEMMNYPGVLINDPEVIDKIAVAKKHGVPIDGHAPGVTGEDAIKYIHTGISTDHECFTYEEAKWKVDHGMYILIREGSAAKNFGALIDLFNHCPEKIMFCSDDKHPDDLVLGHINQLVARALKKGHNLYDVLHAACMLPVHHYKVDVGLLREGDPADFIISDDLTTFTSLDTYIDGVMVAEQGVTKLPFISAEPINHFVSDVIDVDDLRLSITPNKDLRVIHAIDGELITQTKTYQPSISSPDFVADLSEDVLKIVVINRYSSAPPAVALIHGFGLRQGAIASTVAHDCHNIIAVGVDDDSLIRAITALMDNQGGVVATDGNNDHILPLPVAGLMSLEDGAVVADRYRNIDQFSKDHLGCRLKAPFMSLSFMALLVIPSLKLSDLGLFDGDAFTFVNPEF